MTLLVIFYQMVITTPAITIWNLMKPLFTPCEQAMVESKTGEHKFGNFPKSLIFSSYKSNNKLYDDNFWWWNMWFKTEDELYSLIDSDEHTLRELPELPKSLIFSSNKHNNKLYDDNFWWWNMWFKTEDELYSLIDSDERELPKLPDQLRWKC